MKWPLLGREGLILLLLSAWIALPILSGYTGRTEQDETVYFEPVVAWFERGTPANAYVTGHQEGVERMSFLQPPGWLYFLVPFYAAFGLSYLTVRIAFAFETVAFGLLLFWWSRKVRASFAITVVVFALAMTTPALLAEPGRMDLLAGLLLLGSFFVLSHDDRQAATDIKCGVLLGLAGLVHALPGASGALGLAAAIGFGTGGLRRLARIFAVAAATVALLWLPLLWGNWDLLGRQFLAHGERHLAGFAGVTKITTLVRAVPIVMLSLLVAVVRGAMSRERATLLASQEYRILAIPLGVMVGFVLVFTVTYYYYLDFLIPLAASLLVCQLAAVSRGLESVVGLRHRVRVTRAATVVAVLAVLFLARGRLIYDQLLVALNGRVSPEAAIGSVVRSTIPRSGFVVADPVAYYSARPLARNLRELEYYATRNELPAWGKVDFLVLFERHGQLFYRIRDASVQRFIEGQFEVVADRRVMVRSLSVGGVLRGSPSVDVEVGRLVILRNLHWRL